MNLKNRIVKAVAWNSVGNIARQGLMIITLVVMAKFLTPEDFGVFAILRIFVDFMNIFASMGTSQAVIHLDKPSQRMLSSIFYFNIAMGVAFFLVLFLLAWPIAYFFDNPDLIDLLHIISIVFIITSTSLVQKALLEKCLFFKRLIIFEVFSLTLSSIACISSAIYGLGVYSLIIMSLSYSTILTLSLWSNMHWKPSLKFSLVDIKQIFNYSYNLTGFSFINYFARQSDNFLIGKFLGSSSLGIYSLAYKIMLYPLENVSRVIVRVLFPAFSEIKDDNIRFKSGYVKAISIIGLVTFPLMLGLMSTANNFVEVIFGQQWLDMTFLLVILAPIGLMQSIVTTVGSIYMAKGTTDLMFKLGTLNAVVTVFSFVVGVSYGVEGVAISYALANLIMLYPNLKFSWSQINLGVFEGLAKLLPFLIIASFMSIIIYYLGAWLESMSMLKFIVLSIQIILGIVIYVALLMIFYREKTLSLIKIFKIKSH